MVWEELVSHLEGRYTLIALDLLGYGGSPKPRIEYTAAVHVEAIRRTLHQAGVEPPHTLVGLSMGADLVLEFARRWPGEVRELVAIGFPYYRDEAEARVALQHNAWIRLTLRHPLIASVATPALWRLGRRSAWLFRRRSALYSPKIAADALRASYFAFRSSLYNCMVRFRQDEALKATGELRRLFIHGTHDEWATAEALGAPLARYPNTRLEVIEGPHNLVVAEPERTAELIAGHLGPMAPLPNR